MRRDVYSCDVCGVPKGTANHWFLVTYGEKQLIISPWQGATDADIRQADLHICGSECMNKVVSKFMVGQKWKL